MKTIIDLFRSKKFLTMLGADISAVVGAFNGAITWLNAFEAIFAALIAYQAAQGYSDGQSGGITSSQPGTPSAADLPRVVKNL